MTAKNINKTNLHTIKHSVSALDAARMYGLQPNRSGMVCCPFHPDKTPSMKLDERFHCFGCSADGDAIDLTSRLFGISLKEAAGKLVRDFSLSAPGPQPEGNEVRIQSRVPVQKRFDQWRRQAVNTLLAYLSQLRRWKEQYAPRGPSEEWHPLFCEALAKENVIDFWLDVLIDGTKQEQIQLFHDIGKEVEKIAKRMG